MKVEIQERTLQWLGSLVAVSLTSVLYRPNGSSATLFLFWPESGRVQIIGAPCEVLTIRGAERL
jgi:hypothetical protein